MGTSHGSGTSHGPPVIIPWSSRRTSQLLRTLASEPSASSGSEVSPPSTAMGPQNQGKTRCFMETYNFYWENMGTLRLFRWFSMAILHSYVIMTGGYILYYTYIYIYIFAMGCMGLAGTYQWNFMSNWRPHLMRFNGIYHEYSEYLWITLSVIWPFLYHGRSSFLVGTLSN